jgi:cyclic dehypoxanthinyl futalosine synthase
MKVKLEHIPLQERYSYSEILELKNKLTINELGILAQKKRYQLNPTNYVTFLIDRNINYTNICVTECKFCAFYRHSTDTDAYVIDKDTLCKKIDELLKIGGTRILLQGGHNPKLKLTYYIDLLSFIKKRYPTLTINAFSPPEIDFIAKIEKTDSETVLTHLKNAGLDGLPGGGAEILVDRVRNLISPKKITANEWLEVMEIAHKLNLTTTATMVIGFGETFHERIEHLEKLRTLQEKSLKNGYKGFISFILWTAQHDNTELAKYKYMKGFYTTAYDYLETLAIARLYLHNIPHIQASWPTMGEKIASIALHFGADDFGSTMLEENVVSQASYHYKTSMTQEEIISAIKKEGFIPVQRDSDYNFLKVYN